MNMRCEIILSNSRIETKTRIAFPSRPNRARKV